MNMNTPNKNHVNPRSVRLIDLVKDNKKVKFSFFRDKEFWFEQEDGFLFPISLEEITASRVTILAEDKALLYMRWMRKYLEALLADPTL